MSGFYSHGCPTCFVGRMNIDVNSPEVHKRIGGSALLDGLREDQKSEVRNLARMIGLGRQCRGVPYSHAQVASPMAS